MGNRDKSSLKVKADETNSQFSHVTVVKMEVFDAELVGVENKEVLCLHGQESHVGPSSEPGGGTNKRIESNSRYEVNWKVRPAMRANF